MACNRLCHDRDYFCRPAHLVHLCRRRSSDVHLDSDRYRLCYSLANESVDVCLRDSGWGVCPAVGFGCVEAC